MNVRLVGGVWLAVWLGLTPAVGAAATSMASMAVSARVPDTCTGALVPGAAGATPTVRVLCSSSVLYAVATGTTTQGNRPSGEAPTPGVAGVVTVVF